VETSNIHLNLAIELIQAIESHRETLAAASRDGGIRPAKRGFEARLRFAHDQAINETFAAPPRVSVTRISRRHPTGR